MSFFFHPNDFLPLLLGDDQSLPGQLGVVIPPTGPGSDLDSRSFSQLVRTRTGSLEGFYFIVLQ